MPVRYGEGSDQAFARLVRKIIHDTTDGSIFAWTSNDGQNVRGLLPRSISEFRHLTSTPETSWHQLWGFDVSVQFSNSGLILTSRATIQASSLMFEIGGAASKEFGIRLQMWENRFSRVDSSLLSQVPESASHCRILAARDIDAETSRSMSNSSNCSKTSTVPLRPPDTIQHMSCNKILPSSTGTKREGSGRPKTPLSEYSVPRNESPHDISSSFLRDDDCSSRGYQVEFSDRSIFDFDDDGEEPLSHDDLHNTKSLDPDHPYQFEPMFIGGGLEIN
ncbi:het domain-containing protein [Colletotrichum incanum]|uniref:Het domain-containing protein n=1 Tax=Colletotrichum incanum TaxID=1573173 RepID=A0A161WI84_COLIC|nr:het domain-containing protein [Colletotrichum incanum]